MAHNLKGIIFSIEDVLLNQGDINDQVYHQVKLLLSFLKLRNITPVLLANRSWTFRSRETGETRSLFDVFREKFPELVIFSRHENPKVPPKPQAAATEYVRHVMGWEDNECVYVGSTNNDMRTAVNGGLLFLRATWYSHNTDYGFEFASPKEIARFIDTLCLREHFWSHQISDGDFEYYALAPFSTMLEDYARYSADARAAAKYGTGHPDFWLSALVTSMYFTGIHKRIDFVTSYPGHQAGFDNAKMSDDLMTFGKCFRKTYLHDLIERHTTAIKSQTARQQGKKLDHRNQLNTIHLTELPTRNKGQIYKNPPLQRGKTVLLIDDFCTRGYSLEAARKYIEQTGAKVIMVTWLKTINTNIEALGDLGAFNPFIANTFAIAPVSKHYGYNQYLIDPHASNELGDQLHQFTAWDWPQELNA